MPSTGICDSCGVEESHLLAVRRRYIAVGDSPERVLDDVEHWCVSCCTSYPHQPVG